MGIYVQLTNYLQVNCNIERLPSFFVTISLNIRMLLKMRQFPVENGHHHFRSIHCIEAPIEGVEYHVRHREDDPRVSVNFVDILNLWYGHFESIAGLA